MRRPRPMVPAGRMRSLVRIQELIETKDETGAVVESYSDIRGGIVWAQILPFGSSTGEIVTAEALRTTSMFHVTMHYRPGVTERHRLVQLNPEVGDPVLNILSVADPDGRRRRLELVCESGRIAEAG